MKLELSPSEKSKVQSWLAPRARTGCPVCGQCNFEIGPLVSTTCSVEPSTGRINYMVGYPLVAVFCNHCAHAMWFNAISVGIMAVQG